MPSTRRNYTAVLLILIPLVSAGCANLLPDQRGAALTQEQHNIVEVRNRQLAQISTFYLSARLALTANGDAWNGSLRWEQHPGSYLINFNLALGQGALVLTGNDKQVELILADGSRDTASDAENLLFRKTGMEFPVNGLRYWVMGIPNPGADAVQDVAINDQGLISDMRQSDWSISYQSYRHIDSGRHAGLEVPRKIIMKHDGVAIRLVIDHWDFEG